MSETHAPQEREDVIAAGELALGLVEGEERLALETRARTDTGFARLVAHWEVRFAGFASDLDGVAPPRSAKRRIDRKLFGSAEARAGSLWGSLAFWRVCAAVFGGLAFMLAASAVLFLRTPLDARGDYVAALSPTDAPASIIVRIDLLAGVVEVKAFDAGGRTAEKAIDAGDRATELWLVPSGEPPRSLGVISHQEGARIALDRATAAKIAPGATLAVSLEPAGGSPTGAPTGPVIAAGEIQEI